MKHEQKESKNQCNAEYYANRSNIRYANWESGLFLHLTFSFNFATIDFNMFHLSDTGFLAITS